MSCSVSVYPRYLSAIVGLAAAVGLSGCSFDTSITPYEPPPNVLPQLGCNGACHGDESNLAPPRDLQGNVETSAPGVGAHRSHLNIDPGWHLQVACVDCHSMPDGVDDPGHLDGDNIAELTFSRRSTGNGLVEITWDGSQCSNAYCHGATLTGGNLVSPIWTEPTGEPLACDTCHGFPPLPPHEQASACGTCHTTVADVPAPGPDDFLNPDSHINGTVETAEPGLEACDSCHGGEGQPAPPNALNGSTDVADRGVGAHRAHVSGSDWRQTLYCTQCHITPLNVDDPGHIDGDNLAEVTFDGLNPNAIYSSGVASCSNLYCHGNGRNQNGAMTWNQDLPDLRNNCSACHSDTGNGMSGRHQLHLQSPFELIDCEACHHTVVDVQRNFLDPSLHINGNHEVVLRGNVGSWDAVNQRCQFGPCHGGNKQWLGTGDGGDD